MVTPCFDKNYTPQARRTLSGSGKFIRLHRYLVRHLWWERSVLNASRLIAYCGNHLSTGLDLASIVA